MTRALAATLALLVALGALLAAGIGPEPTPEPAPPRAASLGPASAPRPAPPVLARDPFRYGEAAWDRAGTAQPRPVRLEAPAAPSEPPSPEVRLAGFVRRGERVLAALSIDGALVVLGVGEQALGYTLLAADEDSGARVRTPGGDELELAAR